MIEHAHHSEPLILPMIIHYRSLYSNSTTRKMCPRSKRCHFSAGLYCCCVFTSCFHHQRPSSVDLPSRSPCFPCCLPGPTSIPPPPLPKLAPHASPQCEATPPSKMVHISVSKYCTWPELAFLTLLCECYSLCFVKVVNTLFKRAIPYCKTSPLCL